MKNHPKTEFKNELAEKVMRSFGIASGSLLTDVQVAKLMNCSVQTLRNQRSRSDEHSIPHIKWGRCVRYLAEDVVASILESRIDRTN